MRLASLDRATGCWLALVSDYPFIHGSVEISYRPSLEGIPAWADECGVNQVVLDVPIGLPTPDPKNSERPVDPEARKFIGVRRNSVFPCPPRPVLECATYEEARKLSMEIQGKGISQQSFAIFPGIREVDSWMTPELQSRFREMHPEVCFRGITGKIMAFHKSKSEGVEERLQALRPFFVDLEKILASIPAAFIADALDALVGLASLSRWINGQGESLGGQKDERGLRMEMVY